MKTDIDHFGAGALPDEKQALRFWLKLLSCSVIVEKTVRQKLAKTFDTTLPRFDVMAALDRFPEGMTLGELSGHLLVSNGNITGLINRLVEDGIVIRTINPRDRRAQKVRLSRKGERVFSEMAEAHEEWIETLFHEFGGDERDHALALLAQLKSSILTGTQKLKEQP